MIKKHSSPQFNPQSKDPFRISRTKVEMFVRCPRCFYLSQRLGVKAPDGPPFKLNLAIDRLLKVESEKLRSTGSHHPLALEYGIDAIPHSDSMMSEWLDSFKGISYLHEETNLIAFGAPDDIWRVATYHPHPSAIELLSIVDAKATSSNNKSVQDSYYWESYKRQVEFNSWLLAKQNLIFPVSNTSYFIQVNTMKSQESFDNVLKFESKVEAYVGNNDWVEPTLIAIKACLMGNDLPAADKKCALCKYRVKARKFEN